MRADDFVAEKDYKINPDYTPGDLEKIQRAALAVRQYLAQQGIDLTFTRHFFDRISADRGIGKIDHTMLMESLARIANRGLKFFDGKPTRTSYAFYDPRNQLNIEIVKMDEQRFRARTIVRSDRWLGTSQKVQL